MSGQWQTLADPIPDPGSVWDGSRWVLYTVEGDDSAWMAVTTLMGFHNLVNSNEVGDPVPKHWILIDAPVLGEQEQDEN